METTIGQRVALLIKQLNKNVLSFSKSIDKSNTTINNIITERSKPGFDILEAIIAAYPNLNTDWLINGKGEMWKVEKDSQERPDSYLQKHLERLEDNFEKLSKQIEVKDRQIEFYQRQNEQLISLLGKPNDVIEGAQVVPLWEENKATA